MRGESKKNFEEDEEEIFDDIIEDLDLDDN